MREHKPHTEGYFGKVCKGKVICCHQKIFECIRDMGGSLKVFIDENGDFDFVVGNDSFNLTNKAGQELSDILCDNKKQEVK